MYIFKKFIKFTDKYKKYLTLAVLFAVITGTIDVLATYYIGRATDTMVGEGRVIFSELYKILLFFLISIFIGSIAKWAVLKLSNIASNYVVTDMRKKAFSKLNKMPISYFDKTSHGDIISKFTSDVDNVSIAIMMAVNSLFSGVIIIIVSAAFMIYFDLRSAAVIFLMTPATFLVAYIVAKRTKEGFSNQQEKMGELTGYVQETVGNEKLIKALQYESKNVEDFSKLNKEYRQINAKASFASSLTNPTARFINHLSYILVVMVAAFGVVDGRISIGILSSFLLYSSQFAKPFNELSGISLQVQTAIASLERIFLFLEQEEEAIDRKSDIILGNVLGKVDFKDVNFSYNKNKTLMKNVNFEIKKGETIAIVGPTGAGKTTIVNLLMRFYEIDSGNILIDDISIRKSTRDSVRGSIGMVLQDTWIFEGTVYDNIAYSKPSATTEEVIAAAKSAYIHDFIIRLKNGYDTLISEGSGSLSVGQKQLITIARVMLIDPPILILDEATSSIDTLTEKRIQQALNSMMKNKTSFVIAHRLSTIVNADKILVLVEGNIVETGSHRELMNKNGFYKNLYESQFS